MLSCSALTGLPNPDTAEHKKLKVIEVIDGDDIVLADKTRIRLIGIDAPETYPGKNAEPYTGIAKKALERLLLGKDVLVQYGAEEKDLYNRHLAYVYLENRQRPLKSSDNATYNGFLFVNGYLVKMGHAVPRRYSAINNDYELLLFDFLIEARQFRRGIWAHEWDDNRYKSVN